MGAAAVSPHHNPALNIRVGIPCPGFSIKTMREPGKVQVLGKKKTKTMLEMLADGERACFGLVAHKQEKLF